MLAVVGGQEGVLNLHVYAYSSSQAVLMPFLSLFHKCWCSPKQRDWTLTVMFWCKACNSSQVRTQKWKLHFLLRWKRALSDVTMFCLSFARLTFFLLPGNFYLSFHTQSCSACRAVPGWAEPNRAEPWDRIREQGGHSYMSALPLRNF